MRDDDASGFFVIGYVRYQDIQSRSDYQGRIYENRH